MALDGEAHASLGELLRQCRERRRMSREELAARTDPAISSDTIANVERGRTRPYHQTLLTLCAALGLDGPEQTAVLEAWRRVATPADAQRRDGSYSGGASAVMSGLGSAGVATVPQRLHNLPTELSSFVGREREIAELVRLLGTTRLVTLTGPGGVGKTRLALQVASDAADRFANGVSFVPLAPIRDRLLVTSAIARALAVQEVAGRPLLATLQDAVGDRALLLVLDNFEQVLGAAVQVAALLTACPRLRILVTSRAVVHVSGEHDYAVPPLRLPERDSPPPLERLSQYEAVRLFIERAQAAQTSFAVTNESAPVVSEICHRLDGLPLAIELAAARVRVLAPGAILARLGRRLDLLVGGARDQSERHQTLRAAIAWSYDLLDDGERALFRQLAVFTGGCRLEAVEAVAGVRGDPATAGDVAPPRNALATVISLVEQGLVQAITQADGEPRFRLLETIREYGLERLEASGETTQLRRCHAAYYLTFAEDAELKTLGRVPGADARDWLDRLEAEHDNMRAVLGWSQASATAGQSWDKAEAVEPSSVEVGLRLAGALARFWFERGHLHEGRRWLEAALAGMLAREQGDYERAAALLEEGLALGRALGVGRVITSALRQLGHMAQALGDAERATMLLQDGLDASRRMGDGWELAQSLHFLGIVVHQQGNLEQAAALLEESLVLNREIGASFGVAWTLQDLGEVVCDQGDYERATALFERSLALAQTMNYKSRSAWALSGLGFIAARGVTVGGLRPSFTRVSPCSGDLATGVASWPACATWGRWRTLGVTTVRVHDYSGWPRRCERQ